MICLVSEGPMMAALKITSLKRLMHQSQWLHPSALFNQATTTLFNLDQMRHSKYIDSLRIFLAFCWLAWSQDFQYSAYMYRIFSS